MKMLLALLQWILQSMERIFPKQNVSGSPSCLNHTQKPPSPVTSPPLTLRSPRTTLLQSLSPHRALPRRTLIKPLSLNSLMKTHGKSILSLLTLTELSPKHQATRPSWIKPGIPQAQVGKDKFRLQPPAPPLLSVTPSLSRALVLCGPTELAPCEGRRRRTRSAPASPLDHHLLLL